MSQILMEVSLPGETATDIPLKFCAETGNNLKFIRRIMNLFRGIAGGVRQATIDILAGSTQASGTLTLASVVSTNTCVVGLVTYTAGTDFAVGASDAITATNLAAAINADAAQAGIVTASAANAVVTVKALPAGKIGNTIILTGSTNITASASHLANGANGTKRTFYFAT